MPLAYGVYEDPPNEDDEMMTRDEYQFMTNQWEGPKMAAYNAVFGFCRSFGWCTGFDHEGRPIVTKKGVEAIRQYQIEEAHKKSEAM